MSGRTRAAPSSSASASCGPRVSSRRPSSRGGRPPARTCASSKRRSLRSPRIPGRRTGARRSSTSGRSPSSARSTSTGFGTRSAKSSAERSVCRSSGPALDVPALQIAGWHDLFLAGTLDAFVALRGSASAPEQRLVVGPWGHGTFGGAFGEVDFGPAASLATLDPSGLQLGFFEAILAGEAPPGPPVRLFVMGPNIWRSEQEWPLARAQERRLYLRSEGHANSAAGDGRLDLEPPRNSRPDTYVYDPHDPVPTCGGATFLPGLAIGSDVGPRDQAAVERRNDVLVYTTPVLTEDWEVTGPVAVCLFAMTSAPDTDWTAKLVDVRRDGRPFGVCDGIVRARYRRAGRSASFVPANAVERYDIDLGATSIVFPAGHRIRLEISSSNFPRFNRNPNTVGVAALTPSESFLPANQTIFHDADHPSFLALPVVPRS